MQYVKRFPAGTRAFLLTWLGACLVAVPPHSHGEPRSAGAPASAVSSASHDNISASPASSAPAHDLTGVILATKDSKVSVGAGDIVYLDQGEVHGVQVGDRFHVFQRGGLVHHPITRLPVNLPHEFLGELVVVAVHDQTSTALVTDSDREMTTGSVVERTQAAMSARAGATPDLTGQLVTCLETARQAIRAAETAGATAEDVALAQQTLAGAERRLEQAQDLLAQGEAEQARQLLDAAQADCLMAINLGQQARLLAQDRFPARPEQYTVRRGDTLWEISGRPTIYHDAHMWPLIYQANRSQVADPDVLRPAQVLAIPRDYTGEEAATARHRARTRGPWRLGDGPDPYILEGVRR